MTPDFDVIVVGGGPSGSTAAHLLAKQGAKVLMLDRAGFPRVKPCGGGVTARAFAQAPVDLSPVVEQVVHKVRFSYRLGDFFDYDYPETLVYMTQRDRLDAFLAEQAVAVGVEFRDGAQVTGVELNGDTVSVTVEGPAPHPNPLPKGERGSIATITARAMVGADGANGVVARSLGLQPVVDPPVALEANYPYAEPLRLPQEWQGMLALELGSMYGGYGWSFPKEDHFNVGCGGYRLEGGRLREHLVELQHHYGLDDLPAKNLRGHHLPTRDSSSPISRRNALLVGDAAGLVDPMSGEGIYAAFVSGRLAAAAIGDLLDGREADLFPYEAAVERELMPEIREAIRLRDAYHLAPWPCYQALRRNEMLRRSLCQLITGEKTYHDFLGQLGPLKLALNLIAMRGRSAYRRKVARASSVPAYQRS